MKNIEQYRLQATELFSRAKADMAADLKARGIGMIIWDNAQTNFHFLPVVTIKASDGKAEVLPVMGLYLYDGTAYLIVDHDSPVRIGDFYTRGIETRPVAVTLDTADAVARIGNPAGKPGLTTAGSLEEWLNIADCYFQALNDLPQ